MALFMTFGMCLSIFMLDKRLDIQSKVTQINHCQLPCQWQGLSQDRQHSDFQAYTELWVRQFNLPSRCQISENKDGKWVVPEQCSQTGLQRGLRRPPSIHKATKKLIKSRTNFAELGVLTWILQRPGNAYFLSKRATWLLSCAGCLSCSSLLAATLETAAHIPGSSIWQRAQQTS